MQSFTIISDKTNAGMHLFHKDTNFKINYFDQGVHGGDKGQLKFIDVKQR